MSKSSCEARCEQDEESLRKHRQFDTPYSLLPKALLAEECASKMLRGLEQPARGERRPKSVGPFWLRVLCGSRIAIKSDEVYEDEKKLWKKKREVFGKQETWGLSPILPYMPFTCCLEHSMTFILDLGISGRETAIWSNPEQTRDKDSGKP